jgi:hypothetical protein
MDSRKDCVRESSSLSGRQQFYASASTDSTNIYSDTFTWITSDTTGTSVTGHVDKYYYLHQDAYSQDFKVKLQLANEPLYSQTVSFKYYTDEKGIRYPIMGNRHELHKFRYVHGKKNLQFPTANLAPLWEEIEVHGEKVITHLKRLLEDPNYRKFQLRMINSINKQLKLSMTDYDERTVRAELEKFIVERDTAIANQGKVERRRKRLEKQKIKAKIKADELLRKVLGEELLVQLETQRRVELIAKNGVTYEILEDGRVNKLLVDGKKQGLCIVPKTSGNGAYPTSDLILAKISLLQSNPGMFEDIAYARKEFKLAPLVR